MSKSDISAKHLNLKLEKKNSKSRFSVIFDIQLYYDSYNNGNVIELMSLKYSNINKINMMQRVVFE